MYKTFFLFFLNFLFINFIIEGGLIFKTFVLHIFLRSIVALLELATIASAILYKIEKRGFIKEGYYADIVIFSPNNPWTVNKGNILYKCGWSPFEGNTFRSRISHTIVNGNIVYNNDKIFDNKLGKKLIFNR